MTDLFHKLGTNLHWYTAKEDRVILEPQSEKIHLRHHLNFSQMLGLLLPLVIKDFIC